MMRMADMQAPVDSSPYLSQVGLLADSLTLYQITQVCPTLQESLSALQRFEREAAWRDSDFEYLLRYDAHQGMELASKAKGVLPLRVDFISGTLHYRMHQNVRNELLVKAVLGRNKQRIPRVLDATAGLGQDSALLATLGCQVTLVERNPVVAVLLADGLARLQHGTDDPALAARMTLIPGQIHLLGAALFEENTGHDVVYLDPMFPTRTKSAQVKKTMQTFKNIVGADDDAANLLPAALALAAQRVVVKRPAKAPFLAERKPTYSVAGRTSRFDVYQVSTSGSSSDSK